MFVENDKVELKAIYTTEIKKEVVAFLNASGGEIYVGIGDNGDILGIDNPNRVIESITQVVHDTIKPDPSLICSAVQEVIEGKNIIKVIVGEGVKKPYYLAEKGLKSSGVYVRVNNTSQQASAELIRAMLIEAEREPYELKLSVNQQLSFEYVRNIYRKQGVEFKAKHLTIMDNNGMYTNLALLLSDECPFSIKLAVYEGCDKRTFLDRKEFGGSLFRQADDVFAYLMLNNKTKGVYDGLLRVDNFDYDSLVIREALLNAIIHRDYSLNGSVLISVFEDRIEYVSIGGLVYGMTYDDMMLGVSRSRNENLANVFFKVKYVEAYGTGMEKINGSYAGLKIKPKFKVADNGFSLSIPNKNICKEECYGGDNINESILNFAKQRQSITREMVEQEFGIKKTKASSILSKLIKSGEIIKRGNGPSTTYVALSD